MCPTGNIHFSSASFLTQSFHFNIIFNFKTNIFKEMKGEKEMKCTDVLTLITFWHFTSASLKKEVSNEKILREIKKGD